MKVTGATIQQLEKDKPKSRCRKWRLWASTSEGRKSKRFSGTYSQAQDALSEWVAELGERVTNDETFGAYAESWRLWREKSGNLGEQTLVNDKRNVAVLSRELGDARMDQITPEGVKAALLSIKTGGARELSGTYMNNLFTALNNIMRTACDDGRIASNPCARIKPPKCDTEEKAALDQAGMDGVWESALPLATDGDGRAMAVLLMLEAGLRLGEALALSPADVDIPACMLHVRHSMKERSGRVGKTKRPASVRDLPMTERLRSACAAYFAARPDCRAFCASPMGMPIRAQNFRRWWDKRAVEWGCPGFTPHQLRHSNLTKMARFMSVFDLQRWAGWSSIGPAKVYVHADMDSIEAAVRRSQIGAVVHRDVIERTSSCTTNEAGQTA